jgi:uncharacterized membrane protein
MLNKITDIVAGFIIWILVSISKLAYLGMSEGFYKFIRALVVVGIIGLIYVIFSHFFQIKLK